jgi:hypothetical protein
VTRAEKVNLASKYQNSGRKWIHQGTKISRFGSSSSHFSPAALFVTVDQGVFFLFERSGGVFGAICHTQAASNDRFLQKKFAQKSKHRSNFPLICGAVKPSKDPIFFIPGFCQKEVLERVLARYQ